MKHIKLDSVTAVYTQEEDSNSPTNIGSQELTITAQPTLVGMYDDGKKDFYFVIKTDRFAFDSKEEIAELMDDFISRIKE